MQHTHQSAASGGWAAGPSCIRYIIPCTTLNPGSASCLPTDLPAVSLHNHFVSKHVLAVLHNLTLAELLVNIKACTMSGLPAELGGQRVLYQGRGPHP